MGFWLLLGVLVVAAPVAVRAETLLGLTTTNSLVRFNSATPGTFQGSPIPITGLVAGDAVLAIDRRPASGVIYGLGVNGVTARLYRIDHTTGAATQIGGNIALPQSSGVGGLGTSFGFDFNPRVDRVRVVANNGDNFRIDPETGEVVADTVLNTGVVTGVVGAAYTGVLGTPATTLYGIDSARRSS